jgi:glycosyltransferase involved in cell wall biosynthesis
VEPNAEEIAIAMLRLLNDEDLRRRLANSGRREVEERFSAGRMVQNTVNVYEDVLRNRRKT